MADGALKLCLDNFSTLIEDYNTAYSTYQDKLKEALACQKSLKIFTDCTGTYLGQLNSCNAAVKGCKYTGMFTTSQKSLPCAVSPLGSKLIYKIPWDLALARLNLILATPGSSGNPPATCQLFQDGTQPFIPIINKKTNKPIPDKFAAPGVSIDNSIKQLKMFTDTYEKRLECCQKDTPIACANANDANTALTACCGELQSRVNNGCKTAYPGAACKPITESPDNKGQLKPNGSPCKELGSEFNCS